jgi:glycosyltransferase involved in cell wall biosynthesis
VKVLVDATAIPVDLGGVGRYVVELVAALDALGLAVVVVCRPGAGVWVAERAPGAEVLVGPARIASRPGRLVWEQSGLPRMVRATGADVLLSPHYTMPSVTGAARVVTLHDATFFSAPEVHGRVKRRFFAAATRAAVRGADALVVPSRATRDEVVRYTGGDVRRFHVAHHGVDRAVFHPVGDAARREVAELLGLGGRSYVAFLGTLEPRKNVPALVRGWARAVADLPEPPALVLAGGKGWDTSVAPEVDAVDPRLTVLRPGYLPFESLAAYLSGAAVVAYPSLGEGFGLPVLEAMACGAAVLTSRELSLPEVGGDAVAYTGTSDVEIGAALRDLLDDDAGRAGLADRALDRAATFTWERSAREHVAAFEAALDRHRRR